MTQKEKLQQASMMAMRVQNIARNIERECKFIIEREKNTKEQNKVKIFIEK